MRPLQVVGIGAKGWPWFFEGTLTHLACGRCLKTFISAGGEVDYRPQTSHTSFCRAGSGPHVAAGSVIIRVVSRTGAEAPGEWRLIKRLGFASLNSLTPSCRKAFTEPMALEVTDCQGGRVCVCILLRFCCSALIFVVQTVFCLFVFYRKSNRGNSKTLLAVLLKTN